MRRKASDPHSPIILGIETSTPWGGIALVEPGDEHSPAQLVAHRWFHAPAGYSRQLLFNIDSALKEMKRAPDAIRAIACSQGPGSFTGVRVGLTTAKTLAHTLQVPLFLCSTLECTARRWPHPGAWVCVLLDARRNEVYSALYRITDFLGVEEIVSPAVESPESTLEALLSLETTAEEPIWFMGDGATAYRELIESKILGRARFVPQPWNHPAADTVALEGARLFSSGAQSIDPFTAVPFYLRASDAHRNLKPAGKAGE